MSALETQHEVRAVAKWVRMSPRKARLVTRHIQGRTVPEARTVLAFTQRAAAREIEKVLRSAVANAEANHGLLGDSLVVSAAYVDEGPVMKRWRARARGRVARIKKPTCHITVKLAPGPETARIVAPVLEPQPEPEPVGEETATAPAEPAAEPEAPPEKKSETKPKPKAETKPKTETRKPAPKRAPRKKKEEGEN
jgi:large subunit ribosomal protein L22